MATITFRLFTLVTDNPFVARYIPRSSCKLYSQDKYVISVHFERMESVLRMFILLNMLSILLRIFVRQ